MCLLNALVTQGSAQPQILIRDYQLKKFCYFLYQVHTRVPGSCECSYSLSGKFYTMLLNDICKVLKQILRVLYTRHNTEHEDQGWGRRGGSISGFQLLTQESTATQNPYKMCPWTFLVIFHQHETYRGSWGQFSGEMFSHKWSLFTSSKYCYSTERGKGQRNNLLLP